MDVEKKKNLESTVNASLKDIDFIFGKLETDLETEYLEMGYKSVTKNHFLHISNYLTN